MLLQHYLDRIGFRGEIGATIDVLSALQQQHLCTVPFENLDVQLGRYVTTSIEAAYNKIVLGGRGGWCFEQNGLFGWALAEIGFDVTRVSAAVMRQQRGAIADANHLCLLVRLPEPDAVYLADVGFGGSLIKPIPLLESEYDQVPFRLGLRKIENDHWRFWEDIGSGEFSFDFAVTAANEEALQARCEFLQKDPESGFVLNLVAQLRLPDQHKTLRGRVFSNATCEGIDTRVLASADELVSTLAEEFGLDLPEVAELWPKVVTRHEDLLREKALADTYEIRARANDQPLS